VRITINQPRKQPEQPAKELTRITSPGKQPEYPTLGAGQNYKLKERPKETALGVSLNNQPQEQTRIHHSQLNQDEASSGTRRDKVRNQTV
jgi:hypothetical protein